MALVDGPVFKKGSLLRFRVEELGDYVGFGLGLRNVIEGNKFGFGSTNKIGNGCCLLKSNGTAFTHFIKEKVESTGCKFGAGDVVEMETNENELLIREKTGKWNFSMAIYISDEDWHQACFCVYLRSSITE